jgi:DNA-binding transcriptional LysR family regulator
LPQSFHQVTLWRDTYACVMGRDNPVLNNFTLGAYLSGNHVWVSKTGWGAGTGIKHGVDSQKLGWVDVALKRLGKERNIKVYTRHYLSAMLLARQKDLIVTVPTKAAQLVGNEYNTVVRQPPFPIPPIELKMAWSPLLQHNPAHKWMRRLLIELAAEIDRACKANEFLE